MCQRDGNWAVALEGEGRKGSSKGGFTKLFRNGMNRSNFCILEASQMLSSSSSSLLPTMTAGRLISAAAASIIHVLSTKIILAEPYPDPSLTRHGLERLRLHHRLTTSKIASSSADRRWFSHTEDSQARRHTHGHHEHVREAVL